MELGLSYIRRCIKNDQPVPPIGTIAEQFCIDKDYLARRYRSLQGSTLLEYINRVKQERALELLEQKIAIKDIAHRLGYSDLSSFSRAFKAAHGLSPSQYLLSLKL
ncbi:helix-turn-helix transcriptional regulator [Sphingobacterium sp. UT-1RO-CII-1]|uniref:helix-turn-helix transcriptional regulator n=1 Tax=Sphingobacterium sp. UT-1RO-CII-1 TaxID=2995225 RepID=UPI00227A4678|nr:helix-turn-helix transcriptional regulator [Sphingobacterium sp. UT-1RO-CII-1]MCY4779644.1 helix-turn-helix transcriptional regulator [Sphingobacterium sp. UT-1RO-CII-1]